MYIPTLFNAFRISYKLLRWWPALLHANEYQPSPYKFHRFGIGLLQSIIFTTSHAQVQ